MSSFAAIAPAASKPRLGFAGVGWIGRHRLQAIADHVRVTALADPSATSLDAAAAFAPDAKRLRTFDELLALDLDAIVIATPSAQHADQATRALERGMAVYCQKPVGRNRLEVERVVAAARKNNRLVAADLCYRHSAAFEIVRRLVNSGELGNVYALRFVFHHAYGPDKSWFYDPDQSGGGCLIDLGTHLVDLALWMRPEDPVDYVECQAFNKGRPLFLEPGVEDFCSGKLILRSGALVELACSWNLPAGKEAAIEAEVYGTLGGASVKNLEGSFYDFAAYRHRGTRAEVLCANPDVWGGRAIGRWAARLAEDNTFDPSAEELITLTAVLDALYADARRQR